MKRLLELPLLVILLAFAGVAMYVPAVHAVTFGDYATARAFFYSGTLVLVITGMIGVATLNYDPANMARRHLIAIVSSYFVLPLAAALPFALSVPTTTFFNAWFEMISCFTTTGATLYEGAGRLPASVQLWRAMVGWLGGFYILLIAMAVLAPMNLGGFEVLSGGQVGRNTRDTQQITRIAYPSERLARYAVLLFPAYGGLTLLLWIGLLTVGEPNLIALCHAMSTLSTSGITPGLAPNQSPGGLPAEMLIFIFLLFSISRHFWPSTLQLDRKGRLIDDPEVWLGLTTVLIVAVFLFLRHWQTVYVPGAPNSILQAAAALWANLFTVLSFLSTTGYVASGWNAAQTWSGLHAPGLLLVSLSLMGGGVATTAGGVKLLRFYALYKHSIREMEKLVHPHSVGGSGALARRLRREGAHIAFVSFMLFGTSFVLVMAALTLDGWHFEPALVFAAAALSTTGPLVQVATTAPLHYTDLDTFGKLILMVAMVLGRLETLAIFALLLPSAWGAQSSRGNRTVTD